ncbi:MAG: radical SAM protein [Elusimicrobiota bacterium]
MATTRRVLLLAMSGLRIQDARLQKAGLTLPGFVERGRVIASLPSLSLLTLAALCPADWEPVYREYDELPEGAADAIALEGFDLVAISSLSPRILETYRLSDQLRARGVAVALGGLHVSAMPEEAAAHADALVVGEAEPVWAGLLEDAAAGRLRPLYRRRARALWTRPAPPPRYELLEVSRYNRLTLQTARGCPLDCSFCGASRTISPYRLKPIFQVRRELEALLARWPRPFLELADDNSFASKPWSRKLARLFKEYPLRWFTETDISVADDPELLELLAESNCVQLLIGLESASPESLRGLDSRDWKRRRFDGYLEKIRRIQSYGISVNGCFILGLDSDGPECFDETERFVSDSGLAEVQITVPTPFPGTPLFRTLESEGRLPTAPFWDRLTLFDPVFTPRRMSLGELRDGFISLMGRLYSKTAVARRRGAFRDCRRARRTHERAASGV